MGERGEPGSLVPVPGGEVHSETNENSRRGCGMREGAEYTLNRGTSEGEGRRAALANGRGMREIRLLGVRVGSGEGAPYAPHDSGETRLKVSSGAAVTPYATPHTAVRLRYDCGETSPKAPPMMKH